MNKKELDRQRAVVEKLKTDLDRLYDVKKPSKSVIEAQDFARELADLVSMTYRYNKGR